MSLNKGLESRAAFSDDQGEKLADASKNFDRQVEILLQEDLTYLHKRMRKDFPIDRYLMKVTALSKDTKILLNRANSPGLLPWFRSELRIHSLAPSGPLGFFITKFLR